MILGKKKRPGFLALVGLALLNFVFLAVGITGGVYFYEGYKASQELEKNIMSARAPNPVAVQFDFTKQLATGSPLIFGGAHHPPLEHEDAWDVMVETGVTNIRVDFYISGSFQRNVTLESYKKNENNIQDPKNWNIEYMEKRREIFKRAKEKGLTTIGVVSFSTKWLSYNNSDFGVPKDWDVYEDLVKKHYRYHRDYIDYLEIWNEPNMNVDSVFLDVRGSNMTKIEAYEKIYYHASKAIREVDAEINDGRVTPLGGPVSFIETDASFLEPILKNQGTAKNIDFVSYHQYISQPGITNGKFVNLLKRYNRTELPIFISEWSYSSNPKEVEHIVPTSRGITFSATALTSFLKMGIHGANYHSMTAFEEGKTYGLAKNHAFYEWNGSRAVPLPMGKTWQLMSNTLALGKGSSKIYDYTAFIDAPIESVGFTNSAGQHGSLFINTTNEPQFIEVSFKNLPESFEWAHGYIYEASAQHDGKQVQWKRMVKKDDENNVRMRLLLNSESVTGLLLKEDVTLLEKIKHRVVPAQTL